MMNWNLPMKFMFFIVLIPIIATLSAGCARIKDLTVDKAYLTPIPQGTMDAYQYGQPVKTRLQAVMAAWKGGILAFRQNWAKQPDAIYAEEMSYKEVLPRFEILGLPSNSSVPLNTRVWLVVFKGDYTISGPDGSETLPFSGCGFAVIGAENGEGIQAGNIACEKLNLVP
jgi:hypothetical protein